MKAGFQVIVWNKKDLFVCKYQMAPNRCYVLFMFSNVVIINWILCTYNLRFMPIYAHMLNKREILSGHEVKIDISEKNQIKAIIN